MAAKESLRRGLIMRLVIALAAIGVVGVIGVYLLGDRFANLAYDRALFDDVATLADQVYLSNGELRVNLPPAAQKWLLADEGEQVRYRVIDERTGQLIDGNGDLGSWANDMTGEGQPYYRDARVGSTRFRVAYTRHLVDPLELPVLVEVGETLGKREHLRTQILGGAILLIGVMIAAAVSLVWQGVGRALVPLRSVEEEAALRSATNLTPLRVNGAPREVRGLIHAINRMMARVSESVESQRHFTANAAHQLRTPIAGLRLHAQLALSEGSHEALRASVCEIEESATRAAHIIEQLLTLSKAESGERIGTGQDVDLTAVAHHVIERYLAQAIEKDIDLGYEGLAGGAIVNGDEVLLSELLGNLIDNGIRYGSPQGRVTVTTQSVSGAIVLSVSDDGPGFSPAQEARIFQRFYRPDSSAVGGAGLGLAIVKEIAERHAASVRVETSVGQGSRFVVCFPARVGAGTTCAA